MTAKSVVHRRPPPTLRRAFVGVGQRTVAIAVLTFARETFPRLPHDDVVSTI
jgi:hypothetical protein